MSKGRPSKYDPAFCDVVIEAGRAGKSLAWMASEIGVSRDTIWEWDKTIPHFSDALTRAKLLSQRWWEDKGQEGMEQIGFSASIWNRSMAARFPDDWREKSEVKQEVTGRDGKPLIDGEGAISATASLIAAVIAAGSAAASKDTDQE